MKTFATRREFLRTTLLGAATLGHVPGFISRTFAAEDFATRDSATQFQTGKDGPILVIVQLAGGNDGLNTVVPFADDDYHRQRPRLAKKAKDLLKLNDHIALNTNLPFLKSCFDDGDLAVLQGVGYPNPNRSHFRSTEIWETATDSDQTSTTGWVGRYFDNACQGMDPTVGISLKKNHPQAFSAKHQPGIALSAPDLYRWIHGGKDREQANQIFDDINSPDSSVMTGSSITDIDGAHHTGKVGESNLEFLERVALDARISSERIASIAARHRPTVQYPASQIAQQLGLVARMIAGQLPTRIYYVNHGGFDTHQNQLNTHDRLLSQLDGALKAFLTDIRAQGNAGRVTIMTFSEFGRRVGENQNQGTDHGAAAPLFVCGAPVQGGIYGTHPSLTDLDKGDLKFHTDFRSIYATMLKEFLHSNPIPVLGKPFPTLNLFKA